MIADVMTDSSPMGPFAVGLGVLLVWLFVRWMDSEPQPRPKAEKAMDWANANGPAICWTYLGASIALPIVFVLIVGR